MLTVPSLYNYTRKYPLRGYCLAPPGGAAEDNVEERENSEVTQFLVTGYVLRTDGQRDVKVEILF